MNAATLTAREEPVSERSTPFLSHSRINRYLTCPEQYRLHYVERLRPRVPSANLAFGNVLHQALAAFFKSGEDPVRTFLDSWDTLREIDLTFSKRDTWDKLKEAGQAILGKFLVEAAPRLSNTRAVETSFEVSVTTLSLPFVGAIDLIADLEGRRTVVDFKTSSSTYQEHEALLSDQLSVYQLVEPDAVQVALCVLVKTKEPKIEWHVATRSPDQLTEYLTKAAHIAQEIAAGRFYKRPGMWCSWCDFLPVCLGDTKKTEEKLIQIR